MKSFVKYFEQVVKKELKEQYGIDVETEVIPVEKVNHSYTGLTVKKIGSNIAACINCDCLYKGYEHYNEDYDFLKQFICSTIYSSLNDAPQIYHESFNGRMLNYLEVKDKIIPFVCNYERNRELLSKIPHVKLEDLAIAFRIVQRVCNGDVGSVLVNNQLFNNWEIGVDELFSVSKENAMRDYPLVIKSFKSVVESVVESSECDKDALDCAGYVATNIRNCLGAAVLAYPSFFEEMSKVLGGSFYILPSSIHELICIPFNEEADAEGLLEMVSEVNETAVASEEILSDSVYFYDAESEQFSLIATNIATKLNKEEWA